jgi:23S rRNA (cytidine1920-2'-O)/16S rRNA (cytidine1409-2'-O)-methyltransferase
MAERLDKAIAERHLASSRERAQALISAGLVLVNGQPADKARTLVEDTDEIVVTGAALPFVGRGGVKMDAALRRFRLNVRGARCLDVGASTGGFTDCLLQRGAAHVVAIDVGHDQMAPALRADPRVDCREGVNARYLNPADFPEPFDLVAVDVSFISLKLVLPPLAPLVRPGGHLLALVKPEFEAGREAVGPRGVVRSRSARLRALEGVVSFVTESLGFEKRDVIESPLSGRQGNQEFIACFRRPLAAP